LLFVGHFVSETCISVCLTIAGRKSAGFARGPAAKVIASMAAPVSLQILAFCGVFLVSVAYSKASLASPEHRPNGAKNCQQTARTHTVAEHVRRHDAEIAIREVEVGHC